MDYRDIAFSKAKEYALEIVENYQFEQDEYRHIRARLDGERILFKGTIKDCSDMLIIFHEIGHSVLGHSKIARDLSSADHSVESWEDWINREISAFEKAFGLASDITLDRESIKDVTGTLVSHFVKAHSYISDLDEGVVEHLLKEWKERTINILMEYNLVGSKEEATEFMRKAFLEVCRKDYRETQG